MKWTKRILWTWITLTSLCSILLGFGWANGMFDTTLRNVSSERTILEESTPGTMDDALKLARTAQTKLQAMPAYRCIYLRDEFIDKSMNQNHMTLALRHEPFSVLMEWLGPGNKKNSKALYIEGKNDGKMIFRKGGIPIPLKLSLDASIKQKESRHTIAEAGLKNMVTKLITSWEKEKLLTETEVKMQQTSETVKIVDKTYKVESHCVECIHDPKYKANYSFYRIKVYFDTKTELPFLMEAFDWPTKEDPNGKLVERFLYIDIKPATLNDTDFKM